MRTLLTALFTLFLTCGPLLAQSMEEIKNSNEYLHGIGKGYTLKEADANALSDLVNQISVTIKGSFGATEREVSSGTDVLVSETEYENIIKTYSNATLNNTQRFIIKDEPDAEVFRYVKKSEIDRIFQDRLAKAKTFVDHAGVALGKKQIDDALRYYYWAFNLVKSLRYPNEAMMTVDGKERRLVAWLPLRIEEVLGNLTFKAVKMADVENEYNLYVSYLEEPVKSLDFIFFDGADYSPIYSIVDGQGLVDLRSGFAARHLNLKVEYEFLNVAITDAEVENVLNAQQKSLFKKANVSVLLADSAKKADLDMSNAVVAVNESLQMNEMDSDAYIEKIVKLSNEMKALRYNGLKPMFTEEGWKDFSAILNYGTVMVNDNQHLDCFNENGDVVCRGLGCNFKFGRSKVFNETLSFNFDKTGLISHVSLGLGKIAMNDILEKSKWGPESRKKLISFLEDYRTAYAMKDAEYMETVFADDAVIIVGRTLKRDPNSNDAAYTNNKYVELTRLTKKEFVSRLITSFKSKEYINLHLSNLEVSKLKPEKEIYGIQVRQDYYSSNYGDVGYLYLLVDLTNVDKPIIHVRTWQELPDPNFGIIGAGTF